MSALEQRLRQFTDLGSYIGGHLGGHLDFTHLDMIEVIFMYLDICLYMKTYIFAIDFITLSAIE